MSGVKLDTTVAIVGGGIVGASAALALTRMGMAVTLLERDTCGSRSSGVNYGGVRRQGRSLAQLPLSQRAHRIWGQLPQTIGIDGEYERSGHLKVARSEQDMASLEAYRDRTRDFDLGLQLLSRAQLRSAYPWLGDIAVGASLCPDDGHANPRLVSPAFARAARLKGAQIIEGEQVVELARDDQGFWMRTRSGLEVRSRVLLNCAGAWANDIARMFGEEVPMISAHPAMTVTEPLPLFMNVNVGVEGGGLYGRQVRRGNCVIGGARGYALDDTRARSGRSAIFSVLEQAVALFPALRNAHIIRTWSGTEGYLPDREPVLGPSQTTPGLIHAFGFAGAGFQIGPAVGEVLAELVRDGATATPIDAFSIARFQQTRLGATHAEPSFHDS